MSRSKWIEYGVRKPGSTAKPRFDVLATGTNGKVAAVGGVKNCVMSGNPVQPVCRLHEPEKRGAGVEVGGHTLPPRQNCCEPFVSDVAVPGEPFKSLLTAIGWPIL